MSMKYDYIECGDCLELMKNIADKSIDLILCDLPYGTTACKWDVIIPFEPLWEQYNRIIKDNGIIALFGSEPFSSKLRMSNLKMYKYDWFWDRKSTSGFLNAKKRPLKRVEQIIIFSKVTPRYYPIMEVRGKQRCKGSYNKKLGNGDMVYGKFNNISVINNVYYPTNLLEFSNAIQKGKVHPTQKPVKLLEYLIKTYTNEGDVVLDNCMGSGSTCVACINTNRHYIGFEKESKYFDIARERLEKEKEKLKCKEYGEGVK